jgi:EmrB/QacA subfamily drug resistance transporter
MTRSSQGIESLHQPRSGSYSGKWSLLPTTLMPSEPSPVYLCNETAKHWILSMYIDRTSPATPRSGAPAADPRRWKALALLCVASFLVILDAQIVVVAIPSIVRDLGMTVEGAQWVMSGYGLAFGGLLLLGGRAADAFGRRRVFMTGVALFAVSSLLCGLSWSSEILIAARVVQGAAAAIMSPSALSIVMTTFVEGSERNKALGMWGGIAGVGGTAGAVMGGPLTDWAGWEWIFFLNVPISLVLLALSPVVLRESREQSSGRLDVMGAALIVAALVLIMYAVSSPGPWTLSLLAVAAILLTLFLVVEKRVRHPLVPLSLFQLRTMVGGNIPTFIAGMAVFGQSFILTQYAQQVLGYSALAFGFMTAVLPIMAIVGSLASQHLVTRMGFGPVGAASMGLILIGCLLLTGISADGGYVTDMLPGLLIFGLGLGAATVAASIAALTGVPATEAGIASGLQTTSFQLGGAFGVAIMGAVALSYTEGLPSGNNSTSALMDGYQAAFVADSIIAFLGLVPALVLLKTLRRTKGRHA